MCIDQEPFGKLIPRLLRQAGIREALSEAFASEGLEILDMLDRGQDLPADTAEQVREVILEALSSGGQTILALGWDSEIPGGDGAIWITESAGVYLVSSSDYEDQGPFETLDEALDCECFSVTTSNPSVESRVLPLDALLSIARRVVDWENEGSVWINNEEYVASGEELRRANQEGP